MNAPRFLAVLSAALLSITGVATSGAAQAMPAAEKGYTDDTGPYQVVSGWAKAVRPGYRNVGGYAVFAESPNRIYASYVGELPVNAPAANGGPAPTREMHMIVVYDGSGRVIEEWSQWDTLLVAPHYITQSPYDPEKALWVADRNGSQVLKFSNDGKRLLLRVGEKGVERADRTHLGRPASLAFMPDGSFYVADGYVNRRVVKFDKDGKYQLEFGTAGTGPGQFHPEGQVHSIAIDSNHRIYVGDRGNRRIQIFDENGKYLDEWPNIQGPSDIKVMQDGTLWVVSGVGNRLARYELATGRLLDYWGMYGSFPGAMDNPHFISVDSEGNLYLAISSSIKAGIEKYVPRPNADRSRLIGQFLVVR
jgi:sugar lactone lactonase YvrE